MLLGPPALADGDDYFLRDDDPAPLLRYFGHVRDTAGRPIGGAAIVVEVKQPRVLLRATSFPDGGYKAPDLGLYLGKGARALDLKALDVRCEKEGYRTTHVAVPANQIGAVLLDIVMSAAP